MKQNDKIGRCSVNFSMISSNHSLILTLCHIFFSKVFFSLILYLTLSRFNKAKMDLGCSHTVKNTKDTTKCDPHSHVHCRAQWSNRPHGSGSSNVAYRFLCRTCETNQGPQPLVRYIIYMIPMLTWLEREGPLNLSRSNLNIIVRSYEPQLPERPKRHLLIFLIIIPSINSLTHVLDCALTFLAVGFNLTDSDLTVNKKPKSRFNLFPPNIVRWAKESSF